MKLGRILLLLVLVGVGFYISRRGDAAIAFNDELVDLLAASDASFNQFYSELEKYYDGQDVDLDLMRAQVASINETSVDCVQKAKALKSDGGDTGDAFRAGMIAYFEHAQEWTKCHSEIIAHIEGHRPATEADIEMIEAKLGVLLEQDLALLESTSALQQNFAREYKFDLK